MSSRDRPVTDIDFNDATPVSIYTRQYLKRTVQKMNFLNTINLYKGEKSNSKYIERYRNIWNPQTCTYNYNPYQVSHNCMFITANPSFIATDDEIKRAHAVLHNDKLIWNDLSYLKMYSTLYGKRFDNLYETIEGLNAEFNTKEKCIFAKFTYDRRTMNVPKAVLGIRPEHRNKIMYAPQYPINEIKRLHMINYTQQNQANGFWDRVQRSLHCIPYTMVGKKKHGVIYRYRPAFDARIVNQYCYLMMAYMPTMQDLNNFHAQKGLISMFDVKNCFDCIPLHPDDWEYAVAMTPLGLYRMEHLTYGWKNAAPVAQRIMNNMCLKVGNMIAYIDDLCMKHPWRYGTKEIAAQIRKLYEYCWEHKILLNPSKMFIAADQADGFGYSWGLLGKSVSLHYLKSKLLTLEKPTTVKTLENFIGVVGYIAPHVANWAILRYWLQDMKQKTVKQGKTTLNWTPEANIAYQNILILLNDLPILHAPTQDGQFCIKTDACNYGAGAVLYQKQIDMKRSTHNNKKYHWVICDMWSKAIPTNMRHCHSMVHEAWAIVKACEHWNFQLMKRKFLISTDNRPIANLFTQEWKYLNPTTQKTIKRLWTDISPMDFDTYHVPGLKNILADSLSRFTMKMFPSKRIERDKQQRILRPFISTDTNNKQLSEQEQQKLKSKTKIETNREKLNELITEAQKLTFSRRKLSRNVDIHMLNQLSTVVESQEKQISDILSAQDASFNNLMKKYRRQAKHTEYKRVAALVNSSNNLVSRDENELEDTARTILHDELLEMCKILTNCSKSLTNHINSIAHSETRSSNCDHLLFACQHCMNGKLIANAKNDTIQSDLDVIGKANDSYHFYNEKYQLSEFRDESKHDDTDTLINPSFDVNVVTRSQT